VAIPQSVGFAGSRLSINEKHQVVFLFKHIANVRDQLEEDVVISGFGIENVVVFETIGRRLGTTSSNGRSTKAFPYSRFRLGVGSAWRAVAS
jgi:hypothetical protein